MMTRDEFHNGLRILISISEGEFLAAGIDASEWPGFDFRPMNWAIRTSDANYDLLWGIIEARQRPTRRLPEPCLICGGSGWRVEGKDNRRITCICRKTSQEV